MWLIGRAPIWPCRRHLDNSARQTVIRARLAVIRARFTVIRARRPPRKVNNHAGFRTLLNKKHVSNKKHVFLCVYKGVTMTRFEARPGRGDGGKRKSGSSPPSSNAHRSITFATPPAPKAHPRKNKAALHRPVPHGPTRIAVTRFIRNGWHPSISSTPSGPQNAATIYPVAESDPVGAIGYRATTAASVTDQRKTTAQKRSGSRWLKPRHG